MQWVAPRRIMRASAHTCIVLIGVTKMSTHAGHVIRIIETNYYIDRAEDYQFMPRLSPPHFKNF